MTRLIAIAVGVVAVALGAYFYLGNQSTLGNPLAETQASADVQFDNVVEMQIGDPNAPVTMIEYASYTCPHCGRFHNGPYKQLKAEYIDTGKVNFIYREVYFDRYGLWASAVARCAGPDSFFGITDLLYASQSEWTRAGGGDPTAIVDELRKIGRLAGLSSEQIEGCLQDSENLQSLVAWYQHNAQQDGIDSTPSFMINGRKYNNMAYSEMTRILDEAAGS